MPAFEAELATHVHLPTGARHLHLALPVEDHAFLMAFLTPAPDSTGLTHVLEHLVMCGSERYPCRRAFFAMLGRTLSTTMNALTTEDCTAYHFATRSLADYENLLSVYLDAAFFPRLDRLDFEQEGCRVEIEAPGTEREAPVRRGVVLNEMFGLMNEPEEHVRQALNRALFPRTPYRFNSGGDPWEIPSLDYQALRDYHRRHYRPGNAVFLSAGPLESEWLHARLHELALRRFPGEDASSAAHPGAFEVPPLLTPRRSIVRYPLLRDREKGGDSASVALAWRLGETSDPLAVARARLLARCLLDVGDAPLRRALLDAPGHPVVPLASNGVHASRCRLVFQCGVHGCDPDRTADVESQVLEAIDDIARDGLAPTEVEGALLQMEREQRERHDRRYPFPLKLLTRILPAALYGGEPAAALDASPVFAVLRAETRSREGVADLVRACLRDNPERVCVAAVPDPGAARRLDADDRALLARTYGSSSRHAREQVLERSQALRRRQESRAGESSLPKLGLDAIGPPRERPRLLALPVDGLPARMRRDRAPDAGGGPRAQVTGSPVAWTSRGPTGGLAYARLAIDLSDLDPDRLDDVGLFAEMLPESGHGGLGPAETRARTARICDRLAAEPMILARAAPRPDTSGAAAPRAVLLLSARALAGDEEALIEVLADAHLDPRFDRAAMASAARARARRARELTRNGHLHAERVASSGLDAWAALAERWQGPSALAMLARAVEDDGSEPLEDRMHRVHAAVREAPYQLQIVRDSDGSANRDSTPSRAENAPETLVAATPAAAGPSVSSREVQGEGRAWPAARSAVHRAPDIGAWIVEGPVSYCAKVFPAVTADHPDAGPLAVLAAFLGGDLLQRSLRERGGAYGAGARYCDRTCTVRIFSYRDPRLEETLLDFDRAIESLRTHPPERRQLDEAILRTMREIDRPGAFGVAACERFVDELQGRGAEGARPLRASVLRTDPDRMREVIERYLHPTMGHVGVLAGSGREGDLDRLGIPWRRL